MSVRAGMYRESIAVDEAVEAQDETGDPVVTWTEREVVRAEVKPLRGRERLQENAINANIDVKIFTRWAPFWDTVTAKWRIRHLDKGGTIYNVVAITNVDMRNHEVEIMANAGQNLG